MTDIDLRAAAKTPLHETLHSLDVRITNLTAEGCHCNLVAEVALDAIMPVVAARLAEVEAERGRLADTVLSREDSLKAARIERDVRDDWARDVAVFHGMTREGDDDLFATIAKHIKHLAGENARLCQDTERLARRLAGRYEETVGLRARVEWMRPVVKAAEALVDGWRARIVGVAGHDLSAAVDAYRAGQNMPSALPQTLQSDEQAPEVGGEG